MNGHDAIFMGLMGGPTAAAIGGLFFAMLSAVAIFLVMRQQPVIETDNGRPASQE